MTRRTVVILGLAWFAALVTAGCSALPGNLSGGAANAQAHGNKPIDPQQVQATTMSFATRYTVTMADVYDRVQLAATSPEGRFQAQQCKLQAGLGAMGNAVNPNPIVGCMDMAVMVALSRESLGEPWAKEAFGADDAALVVAALTTEETDIWNLAGGYLNPDQITELRALAQRWRKEHPAQRDVGGARLADFPEAKAANTPALQLATSVFGLVRLDPFTGLDPAVRQIEESRVLAERMFFYLQNMPTLISWQTDVLYTRMLAQPQVAQLFKDTATVSANTTGFTEATTRFAEASSHFAQTLETFRAQLPEQQATLVKQVNNVVAAQRDAALQQANTDIAALRDTTVRQLNELVATQRDAALQQAGAEIATQRDAALKQASAEISVQREAVVQQLNSAITAQQDLMARNLQGTLDGAIDRLYQSVRSLILLAAGVLLAVFVIYRLIAGFWPAAKPRP